MEPTTKSETFSVAEWRLDELHSRLTKINRRAEKLGKAALCGYSQVGEEYRDEINDAGKKTGKKIRFVKIEFRGEAPVVEGWQFVCRVEHTEAGNLISRAPGNDVPLPGSVRTDLPRCDHCLTKRNRKDTFIIREVATGTIKMIGRNCLADYLRSTDVADAVRVFEFLSELKNLSDNADNDCCAGGGGDRSWYLSVRDVLAASAKAIELWGWTSKAAGMEANCSGRRGVTSTSSRVSYITTPRRASDPVTEQEEWAACQPSEAHNAEADKVIEWAEELATRTGNSDYLHNVRVAINARYMGVRTFGIVCSAVTAYRRDKGLDVRSGRPVPVATGGYVGEVGKRLRDVMVTVSATKDIETMYGTSTLITMVDADGNQFKTFATNGARRDHNGDKVEGGIRYLVIGTVKKHEEFRGSKSTMLSRCKFQRCS